MNFKTTLVLLVLLIGAGAYIIIERYNSGKEPVEPDTKRLFDIKKADDVTTLTIKSADGSEIVLAKDDKGGKWKMTKPFEAAAESFQVDGLVRDIVEMEAKAVIDPGSAATGLDKPRFHIEASAKGGKLVKFDVGDKTQLGDMYVRVQGAPKVSVVSSEVYEKLAKPANDLRDKQLITTASMDIKQLVIETPGQKLVLNRKGADWEMSEPRKLPADESVMTDLLGAVTNLRATDWIAKDSSDLGRAQFDKPQMTVSFTTAAPATQPMTAPAATQPRWTTIVFGQYEDIRRQKVYAKISDGSAIVKVAVNPLETLTKKPLDLRDKKLVDILPEQVSKLAVASDLPADAKSNRPAKKGTIQIERRKEVATPATAPATRPATQVASATTKPAATKPATSQPATTQAAPPPPPSVWVLKGDARGDADDEAVRSLLTDLHPLRVTKYMESTPSTKPTGRYVLTLTTEGPGGTPVTSYELKFIDPGNDQPLLGEYNGLSFEVPRTLASRFDADFARKSTATTKPSANANEFKLPGEK